MRPRSLLAVLVPFLFVATLIAPQVARAADEPTTDPAPGWVGERVVDPATDDWEPAVAADPNSPFVYIVTTRFGQPKLCTGHCPSVWMALTISSDGGATWSTAKPLCICRGSNAQYDPTIEVVPDTGDVYSVFLNADRAGGLSTVFIKSSDHGENWTKPVHVYGKTGWTDKPEVTMSPDGHDVYASWNGLTNGDLWMGLSHDYGATWTRTRVVQSTRYFYAYDAKVLPDGTVIFTESSFSYTAPKRNAEGEVWHHALISRDGGAKWENVIVNKVGLGPVCASAGCYADFHTGEPSVSTDANGHLVYAYEGSPTPDRGPQFVYVKTSGDEGLTWSDRTALSADGGTPASRASRRRATATSASGTCRRRTAGSACPGTSGTAARSTAASRGPIR